MTTTTTDLRPVMHRSFCRDADNVKYWVGRAGDQMAQCRGCRMLTVLTKPAEPEPPTTAKPAPTPGRKARPPGRYWLGCCDCGTSIWLESSRPRVPLCRSCATRRTEDAASRRRRLAELVTP